MAHLTSKQERDNMKAIVGGAILSSKKLMSDEDYSEQHKGTLDLLERGGHCKFPLCRQFTFLPLACQHCALEFCRKHQSPVEHKCKNMPKEQAENRISVCPKCSKALVRKPKHLTFTEFLTKHQASGCKKYVRKQKKCQHRRCKMAARFLCFGCNKKFCVPHRWDDMHNCSYSKRCRDQVKNVSLLRLERQNKV